MLVICALFSHLSGILGKQSMLHSSSQGIPSSSANLSDFKDVSEACRRDKSLGCCRGGAKEKELQTMGSIRARIVNFMVSDWGFIA